MKKYTHIKRVKRKLTPKEMEKFKDFDALKTNYQRAVYDIHKKPVYKNPKFFFGLLMVILIAYILFEMANSEEQSQKPNTEQTAD